MKRKKLPNPLIVLRVEKKIAQYNAIYTVGFINTKHLVFFFINVEMNSTLQTIFNHTFIEQKDVQQFQ